MVTASKTDTFIPSKRPVQFELQNGGRVLILRGALKHPTTKIWHDIRIERTGWFKWFQGSFNGISPEEAEQIRKTYDIVLRTSHMNPGEGTIYSDLKSTHFEARNNAGGLEKKVSYPYKAGRADTELATEDAAYFGQEHMTVHDAMVTGILNTLGIRRANTTSAEESAEAVGESEEGDAAASASGEDAEGVEGEEGSADTLPRLSRTGVSNSASQPSPISKLPSIPRTNVGSRTFRKADENTRAAGLSASDPNALIEFDGLTGEDNRKKRLIAYLDRAGPIPFSPFVENNHPEKIDHAAFLRLQQSLGRLAVRDALGKLAALEKKPGLSRPEAEERDRLRLRLGEVLLDREAEAVYEEWRKALAENTDDKYMQELLEHWFRAVYHYLSENSHADTAAIVPQLRAAGVPDDQVAAKAEEIYWRRWTPTWLSWLRPLLPLSSDWMSESLSQTKLNPAWW